MTKVLVTSGSLEDIADAIRMKLGVQTTYKPSQMASAIETITSAVLQSKTATPSASDQTIQPDSGYNGLSSVVVSGDSDLVAGNIKKDVQIFGVTGSYEGSGGGGSKNILSGTTVPTSSQGSDGDLYITYIDNNVGYKYIKFTVSAIRGGSRHQCQFSEIVFSDGTNNFSWPSGTSISSTAAGATWQGTTYVPDFVIDGNLDTKFDSDQNFSSPIDFVIDLGSNAIDLSEYNKWMWYTANDTPERDPISFSLSVSNDGINYTEVDSVENQLITTSRKAKAYEKEMELGIIGVYLKVNGSWVDIIGQDIDDVNTGTN